MLYFLIPVYNEENNLAELKKSLLSYAMSYNKYYVFSDDGSTDGTIETIKKLFQGLDFVVLSDGKNHGPGNAFNVGFNWILDHSKDDTDRIVTMEADNTSDIKILEPMLSISELGFDLVLASVYAQGGGFDKTSFMRKFYSLLANFIFRFIFDIKILTLSSFYRVHNIATVRKIKTSFSHIIEEKGFIAMLEVLLKAVSVNARIIEVPMVLHSSKRMGKSKMKIFRTFMDYMAFIIKFRMNRHKY